MNFKQNKYIYEIVHNIICDACTRTQTYLLAYVSTISRTNELVRTMKINIGAIKSNCDRIKNTHTHRTHMGHQIKVPI